jgi:hypothetical protein
MKPRSTLSRVEAKGGYLLEECLVYLGVFTVVLGLGLGAFCVCWDYSKALHGAADDITAALRAGERWRADIRKATGKITVETTTHGQVLRIPQGRNKLLYRFNAGEVRRQVAAGDFSELMLPRVKASQMLKETRGPVTAWRWEVELTPRRKETRLPWQFTFEAAPPNKP